jgi:hypothetical protein
MVEMRHGAGVFHAAAVVLCVMTTCVTVWGILRFAHPIGDRIGQRGLDILNRLFGVLLAAMAVKIIATGLRSLFPVLAGSPEARSEARRSEERPHLANVLSKAACGADRIVEVLALQPRRQQKVRKCALTGSAGRPQAFPLLKVDRQCCVVAAFLRLTPFRHQCVMQP